MKKIEQVEFIGLFVGVGEFSEQIKLANQRVEEGWFVGGTADSAEVKVGLSKCKNMLVKINGANAGWCVWDAGVKALQAGAIEVLIDLTFVMGGFLGDRRLGSAMAMAVRTKKFAPDYLDDQRFKVVPEEVWRRAKLKLEGLTEEEALCYTHLDAFNTYKAKYNLK